MFLQFCQGFNFCQLKDGATFLIQTSSNNFFPLILFIFYFASRKVECYELNRTKKQNNFSKSYKHHSYDRTSRCQCHTDSKNYLPLYFIVFFKNGPSPASFSFNFGHFQTNINTILQEIIVQKCPCSTQCWDSNPQPSEVKSPPVTTRPGLPPKKKIVCKKVFL